MDQLIAYLSQEGCCLTHLSLAGTRLTDSDICTLARCLLVCPSLVCLDLSGIPGVTAAGLEILLSVLREGQCTLQSLNLAGCLVSGPWDSISLDSLSCCLQEFLFTEAQQTGQGGSGVGQETGSDQCNVTAQQVFH